MTRFSLLAPTAILAMTIAGCGDDNLVGSDTPGANIDASAPTSPESLDNTNVELCIASYGTDAGVVECCLSRDLSHAERVDWGLWFRSDKESLLGVFYYDGTTSPQLVDLLDGERWQRQGWTYITWEYFAPNYLFGPGCENNEGDLVFSNIVGPYGPGVRVVQVGGRGYIDIFQEG